MEPQLDMDITDLEVGAGDGHEEKGKDPCPGEREMDQRDQQSTEELASVRDPLEEYETLFHSMPFDESVAALEFYRDFLERVRPERVPSESDRDIMCDGYIPITSPLSITLPLSIRSAKGDSAAPVDPRDQEAADIAEEEDKQTLGSRSRKPRGTKRKRKEPSESSDGKRNLVKDTMKKILGKERVLGKET